MIPIRRRLYQSLAGFSPRQLFSALQGAWYEPTTDTTYQEHTGITPGALGSTVGLLLDRSQGLVIGPELVTNGDFSDGTTGWQAFNSTLSVVAGALQVTSAASGFTSGYQTISGLTAGATYTISVGSVSGGVAFVQVYDSAIASTFIVTCPAGGTAKFTSPDTNVTVNCLFTATASGQARDFDSISVRQILGNHATQATATARPILQAAPNRLVFQADDSLVTTFPAALGTDCTVARGVAGGDPVILTGQNMGTTYTLGLEVMEATGLVIVNGPLNPVQTTRLTRYLKALG